ATRVAVAQRPRRNRATRTQVSIAANARIGAGTIEYWKWNDQKFGDEDQNRSRNDGSATSSTGETSGSRAKAANEPIHTRVFVAGVNSSLRLSIGCWMTCVAALRGPVPSASYVQWRYATPPPSAGMTKPSATPSHTTLKTISNAPTIHRRCTTRM